MPKPSFAEDVSTSPTASELPPTPCNRVARLSAGNGTVW